MQWHENHAECDPTQAFLGAKKMSELLLVASLFMSMVSAPPSCFCHYALSPWNRPGVFFATRCWTINDTCKNAAKPYRNFKFQLNLIKGGMVVINHIKSKWEVRTMFATNGHIFLKQLRENGFANDLLVVFRKHGLVVFFCEGLKSCLVAIFISIVCSILDQKQGQQPRWSSALIRWTGMNLGFLRFFVFCSCGQGNWSPDHPNWTWRSRSIVYQALFKQNWLVLNFLICKRFLLGTHMQPNAHTFMLPFNAT